MRHSHLLVGWFLLLDSVYASDGVSVADCSYVDFHGVSLPSAKEVGGLTTALNGHGLRQFSLYGIEYDMYVAGLYTSSVLRTEAEIMEADGPFSFDFVFLKNVPKGRMKIAWKYQIDASVSHIYDGFQKDKEDFVRILGGLRRFEVQSVQLYGNDTVVVEDGEVKGRIKGKNFQKAFMSMWFGEQAVNVNLKDGLLGKKLEVCAT